MKQIKTEINEFGWYWLFRERKDGTITILQRTKNKKFKKYEKVIQVYGKASERLKEFLK